MKNKITKSMIRNLLLESVFDPKKPGPLEVITAQENPSYYEGRAIEYIKEAQIALKDTPNPSDHQMQVYHERMSKAAMLLTLARATRGRIPKETIK